MTGAEPRELTTLYSIATIVDTLCCNKAKGGWRKMRNGGVGGILVCVTAPLPLRAALADENLLLAHVAAKLGQRKNMIRRCDLANEQGHPAKHVLGPESIRVQLCGSRGGERCAPWMLPTQ